MALSFGGRVVQCDADTLATCHYREIEDERRNHKNRFRGIPSIDSEHIASLSSGKSKLQHFGRKQLR